MMTGLILRNPVLRGLGKPLALCILVATFAGNMMAFFSAANGGSGRGDRHGSDVRWSPGPARHPRSCCYTQGDERKDGIGTVRSSPVVFGPR